MELPDETAVTEELLRVGRIISKHTGCSIKSWTIAFWELDDRHEPPKLTELASSSYKLEDLGLAVFEYLSLCREFIVNPEGYEIEVNLTSMTFKRGKVNVDFYITPSII